MRAFSRLIAAVVVCAAFFSTAAFAAELHSISFWRWDTGKASRSAHHFSTNENGSSIAVGDLGNDGVAEVVIGAPIGASPEVRILRGDGSRIIAFLAYDKDMTQGVTVGVGDVNGDGKKEIVTGTGPGAVAQVRVFTALGTETMISGGFFPYGKEFKGGVNVAVADVDSDGRAEIITAPGPTGGPNVQIWSGDGVKKDDFFAFDNNFTGGLHIAAGDLDSDGRAEIVAALADASPPTVRIFSAPGRDGTFQKIREFTGIDSGFRGGLNLAIGDVDGDGRVEILVAPNSLGGPHVHVYRADGSLIGAFFSGDESDRGGVVLGVGHFSTGNEIVTMPAGHDAQKNAQEPKSMYVSVKDQRLFAYEHGRLVKTFLVATGMKGYPTPLGDFQVLAKPFKVNYRWSYGVGNPNNYDLGWVTWNLRFGPHVYIHYAPWRKVFGVRGSHGCVNVSKTDAQWIYAWADLKTPITIE